MSSPHVLAIPFQAQGHVIPLMELCLRLVEHGFKVTFVNTDYNHKRVLTALEGQNDYIKDRISLASIPDGVEWEDRSDLGKIWERMVEVMPGKLEELINRINNASEDEEEKIKCVIADESLGWALEVAEKMNIRRVAFWPASAALLALVFSIPKLIDDGIVNDHGTPLRKQMVQVAPRLPSINAANLVWACMGDSKTQKIIFDSMVRNNKAVLLADWIICNSEYNLEPGAFNFAPKIQPIGPLLASNRFGDAPGNFWKEDATCLNWLDQQPPNSVIYVAFGSFTIFDRTQFQELAIGLELTKRPFLWAVRQDIINQPEEAYPKGFHERVASQGRIVGWAPQQKVLTHPSIGCFISHCGWNSTMEGVGNGVPFLCWPYFGDQFLNESYICDVWKVGLKLDRNESGIITKEEIKSKVEKVMCDQQFKCRALELKEIALKSTGQGGHSSGIFRNFMKWMKQA